ncbi:MAG: hypothetical protein AAF467_10385 [Actinomycetota bacterium]
MVSVDRKSQLSLITLALLGCALALEVLVWGVGRAGARTVRHSVQGSSGSLDFFVDGVPGESPVQKWPAVLKGVAVWLEIVGALTLAAAAWPLLLAVAVFVGWRLRVLQEVGHVLVHTGLGLFLFVTDLIWSLPMAQRSAQQRYVRHVELHHGNGTLSTIDPHRASVRSWLMALESLPLGDEGSGTRPLTRSLGVLAWSDLRLAVFGSEPDGGHRLAVSRQRGIVLLSVLLPLSFLPFASEPVRAAIVGWLIARSVVYPVLAWFSELLEHHWAAGPVDADSHVQSELQLGHVLAADTLLNWLIVVGLQPFGERFHMLHSLRPDLSPASLGAAHAELLGSCADYRCKVVRPLDALTSLLRSDAGDLLTSLGSE